MRRGSCQTVVYRDKIGWGLLEGLYGTKEGTDSATGFSYETPFGEWAVRNAILLLTDKVLFQLGTDQICVYDPEMGRIACDQAVPRVRCATLGFVVSRFQRGLRILLERLWQRILLTVLIWTRR